MMKGLQIVLKWGILPVIFMALSCHKDNRTELFVLNQLVDFDVQPGLNTIDTHFFVIAPLKSTYDQKLSESGYKATDVIGIESKDAYLSSIFKDVNLRFIDQVSIYIFDPFNPDDKIEFFYFDPVPYKNTFSLRLFPGIADLTHWVDQEFFGVEIRLHFREVTTSLTRMRFEFYIRALGN